MGWLAQVVAHHPYVVLFGVTVFSATCLIVPLSVTKFPNFRDPQLGFEARGTEIGQRLVALRNLLSSIGPMSLLTTKPVITPVNKKQKSKSYKKLDDVRKAIDSINSLIPRNNSEDSLIIADNSDRIVEEDEEEEGLETLKEELEESVHHDHMHLSPDQFFCTKMTEDYGRFVVTSIDGSDLFEINAIRDMCNLEHSLMTDEEFTSICEQITTNWCCRQWSLPNYIAMLNNKTSCHNVTESDVKETKKLFITCHRYFFDMNSLPNFRNKDVPPECMKHDAMDSMIHYILDYEYTNLSLPLKNVMVFLPIARSSSSLDYYLHIAEKPMEMGKVKIAAIDFGLKYTLFDEYLIKDTHFMFYGALAVLLTIWFYTGSLFITIMTLFMISFSLGISYFLYRLVFGFKFFPFMNMLASVVAIGIGGDASLLIFKLWTCAKENESDMEKIVRNVHAHSIICTMVSSLTTGIAFYSSFISKITTIRCFSMFAGTSVVANFLLLIFWAPATLVVSEKVPSLKVPHIILTIFTSVSQFSRKLIVAVVMRFRFVWLVLFSTISLLSILVIFYYPKFRLPDSTEFQLFSSSHLFERYDLIFKDRFHFERSLRMEYRLENQYTLPLRFVWGVVPEDNGDYLDPFERGKLVLDNTFDLASKDSQTWLLSFCTKLKMQPFYHPMFGPLMANCFIETFIGWMEQKCIDPVDQLTREPCCESAIFPYDRNVFSLCFAKAAISLKDTPEQYIMSPIAGPKFLSKSKAKTPKVKAFIVEYKSTMPPSSSFKAMDGFFNTIEEWTKKEFSSAPAGMRNGWFISDLDLYDLQKALIRDTISSILIAMAASFIIVALTTFNIILSLLAMITITSSILVTVATLVLLGWKLNVLEAISICLAIGLAVDFSMHYTINYKYAPENADRNGATIYTLSIMTGPVSMAAFTTLISGAFMLPSHILAYTQIGTFLVVVMVVSWSFATFFLTSLLSIVGPLDVNRSAVSSREQHELEALSRSRRRAEHSPSAASATTIIHEEECEIILKPTVTVS